MCVCIDVELRWYVLSTLNISLRKMVSFSLTERFKITEKGILDHESMEYTRQNIKTTNERGFTILSILLDVTYLRVGMRSRKVNPCLSGVLIARISACDQVTISPSKLHSSLC